jgi:hypothetical protein
MCLPHLPLQCEFKWSDKKRALRRLPWDTTRLLQVRLNIELLKFRCHYIGLILLALDHEIS